TGPFCLEWAGSVEGNVLLASAQEEGVRAVCLLAGDVEGRYEAFGNAFGEFVATVADLGDQFHGRRGARLKDLIGELLDRHAVIVDERLEGARIVGGEVGGDFVIFGLADEADDVLE